MPGGPRAEELERVEQDRRRAHAVDVVVAVDHDPAARLHVVQDERGCRLEIRDRSGRIGLPGKPGPGLVWVDVPTTQQRLRGNVPDSERRTEPLERCSIDGGDDRPRVGRAVDAGTRLALWHGADRRRGVVEPGARHRGGRGGHALTVRGPGDGTPR